MLPTLFFHCGKLMSNNKINFFVYNLFSPFTHQMYHLISLTIVSCTTLSTGSKVGVQLFPGCYWPLIIDTYYKYTGEFIDICESPSSTLFQQMNVFLNIVIRGSYLLNPMTWVWLWLSVRSFSRSGADGGQSLACKVQLAQHGKTHPYFILAHGKSRAIDSTLFVLFCKQQMT